MPNKKSILIITIYLLFSFTELFGETFIVKVEKNNRSIASLSSELPNARIDNIFGDIINSEKIRNDSPLSAEQISGITELSEYYLINIPDVKNDANMINKLRSIPGVISAEPNYLYGIDQNETTPNDSGYKYQWGLKAVSAGEAWRIASGEGIFMGVVDTGIEWDHPDLENNIYINSAEDINNNGKFDPWSSSEIKNGTSGDLNAKDDDGNGYVDDIIGYDFVDQTYRNIGDASGRDPIPADEHSHGTVVSGVIAAERNNKIGIAGLAYNSRIVTLRALDANGTGEADDLAQAIVYAALNGVDVLNFSFGEPYVSSILKDAIEFAAAMGCTMVASSGNNGWDRRHFPSDHDHVISVGALNSNIERDWRSNYGSHLDICAPGISILTTTTGKSYKRASGTSLAAPHVSAVAAMMLQRNPALTSAEIRGTLRARATDLGWPAWDYFYASGLLNAEKSLNYSGITNIIINYPENEMEFNRDVTEQINIVGTVATPLLDYYEIFIGKGINPKPNARTDEIWTKIIDGFTAKNDTLAKINTAVLEDTVYTIRVVAHLKNNNTIEERANIYLYSSGTKNEFIDFKTIYPLYNNKRIALTAATTSRVAQLSIKYRLKNSSEEYYLAAEKEFMTRNHVLALPNAAAGIEYEAIATARLRNGDSLSKSFSFSIPPGALINAEFSRKDYKIPPAYLCTQVTDLYDSGNPVVAINELTSYLWNNIKTFEFEDGEFSERNESKESWIPSDMGESNGDGIPEILAFTDGMTRLYQASSTGSNPFDNILYSNELMRNFWAAGMHDLDGDGLDEIIAYSDTSFIAYSYKNDKYQPLAIATSEGKFKYLGTFPGFASGDFDSDGRQEICHGSSRGFIYIYEYHNGEFTREYLDSNGVEFTNQYMSSGDVDGDGHPEIFTANYGKDILFDEFGDEAESVWKFRLLKSIAPDTYEYQWEDYVYGVRAGIGYRNGFSAGDIDAEPGEEIIASPFPNLYIYKWDKAEKTLKTMWRYHNAFTNAAVVYDFDQNGINEFGFSTGFETYFYEYRKNYAGPARPNALEGYATSETIAFLYWEKSPNAGKYEIFEVNIQTQQAQKIGESDTTTFTAENLLAGKWYYFAVRAVNSNLTPSESEFSYLTEVYTHAPIKPVAAVPTAKNSIYVSYTGELPTINIEPHNFVLSPADEGANILPQSAIPATDTSLTLIYSGEIRNGEYSLRAGSFNDRYESPTIAAELNVAFEFASPEKELFLKKLDVEMENKRIRIEFSEALEENSASDPGNYILRPIGEIISAETDQDNDSAAILGISGFGGILARGKEYTITAEKITAKSGRQMTTGPGNTLGFVFAPERPDPYVYPHPVKLSETREIMFANIPNKSKVYIMGINGELLRTLTESDGNGGVEWNGRTEDGEMIPAGVYLYKVESPSENGTIESEMKKLMILP